jgi:hypothetical protein
MWESFVIVIVHLVIAGVIVYRTVEVIRAQDNATPPSRPTGDAATSSRALAAIDFIAGIGVVVIWVALFYMHAPVIGLWQNAGMQWTAALFNTA